MRIKTKTLLSAIIVIILAVASGLVMFHAAWADSTQALTERIARIYTQDHQDKAQESIDRKKASGTWTADHMLVVRNPYGTNTTGLYVYFKTAEPTTVSYTVSVDNGDYPDFTATPYGGDTLSTEHEFQVIGIVPGTDSTVSVTTTTQNGTSSTKVIKQRNTPKLGWEETQVKREVLDTSSNTGIQDGDNGLYAILGNDSNDQDYMFYYDHYGVLRAEIPILYYRSHRLLFDDQGLMYFSISTHDIVAMNRLGRVVKFYTMPGNTILHHDYVFDNDGNLLVLATDLDSASVQDEVVLIDRETGEGRVILDMGDLFGDYKSSTVRPEDSKATDADSSTKNWDWFHANTIQQLNDGGIILSSRETSTIVKIDDPEGDHPSIGYMLGEKTFWNDTAYAQYVYDKTSDFPNTGGQHSVTVQYDPSLPDGQYYLYMFDNNFGYSTSNPDYDWSQVPGIVTSIKDPDATSYYVKLLVDENTHSYSEVERFPVPFSAYVSSVQQYTGTNGNDSIVIDSGMKGVWGVYADDGTLLERYTMQLSSVYIYRVYKYTFGGFYFA